MAEEITQEDKKLNTDEQNPIQPQEDIQNFGRPVMVGESPIAQKNEQVGAFGALIKGIPSNRDSAFPYNPTYKPTAGELFASTAFDFMRSGIGVAMETWSPEVRAARNSIDALRRVNPEVADKVEEETLGKKLSPIKSLIKGSAATGEAALSIFPFFKFGRGIISAAELALLGKTGQAIKLGEEAITVRKIATGFGGDAIKGTPVESLIIKSEQEAADAILKLGAAGRKFAQSPTLKTLYSSGLNGALYGGLYGLHANEGSLIEGLKGAATGSAFGLGLGAAATGVSKAGKLGFETVKLAQPAFGVIDRKLVEVLPAKWHSAVFSVGTTMKKYYGDIGEAFTTMYDKASKLAQADLGRLHLALIDKGLIEAPSGLRKAFKNVEYIGGDTQRMTHYNEVLQGLGAYSDKEYQRAAIEADPKLKFLDRIRKRYFALAQRGGLLDAGRDPDTYLPKHTPIITLKEKNKVALKNATTDAEREDIFARNDPMVREMVENSVFHEKSFRTLDEAYQAYYDYAAIVESGSHEASSDNKMIQWMIFTGKARDEEEAKGMIIADLKFRKQSLTPQAGSLDFRRKVNLPWYDPNPARVMPQYAYDASMRIEMAKKFGADDGILKKMIGKVEKEKGKDAAKTFEQFVRRVTDQVERQPVQEQASNFLRAIEILKMTYAPIMNLGQSLNTLLATDFGVTLHGLRTAFTDKNIRNAIERGVLTNTLIRQIFEYNSGGVKLAEKYLKYIGFTYSEMFNRAVASAAADKWVENNLSQLLKRYGLKELSTEELNVAKKMLANKSTMEDEALFGGLKVQQESFNEFKDRFPNVDFKANVGNISAAKETINKLETSLGEETAKRQDEIAILEKELLAEAEPVTIAGTQDLRQQIIEMRKQLVKEEKPEEVGITVIPKEYTKEEVSGAVEAATQLKREQLKRVIADLENKLKKQESELSTTGEEVITEKQPKKVIKEEERTSDQKIADINARIETLKSELVGLQNDFVDKERVLNDIIDSYRIAGKRAFEKFPEGLEYDRWLAGRKIALGGEKEIKESGLAKRLFGLTKEQGGATLDIYGNVPPPRYVYAQKKETEFSVPLEDATEEGIEKYILAHLDEYKSGKYVGTWVDKGRFYNNVSTASNDYKNSLLEAAKAEQIGIYDQRTRETKYIKDAIKEGIITAQDAGGRIPKGVSPQDLAGRTEVRTLKESILDRIKRERPREYYALLELGLPVEDIVARGFLTQEEKALAAQAFVEKTQFLGRPLDLPYFASSPVGKVFFQFKTFAYQQARFVAKTLKNDFERGDKKKALRDILILTTVFPATGEVLADIRSLITQEKRPTKAFDRYISDIFSAGTYGILADMYKSAEGGNLERFLIGAAPGDIVNYIENLIQIPGNIASGDADRSIRNLTKQLLSQTGVGKPISNIAFPARGKGKTSVQSLQDLLDWDGD